MLHYCRLEGLLITPSKPVTLDSVSWTCHCRVIWVFCQGHRCPLLTELPGFLPFSHLAELLAICWLVLCCICANKWEGWRQGSPLYTPSPVRVIFSLLTTRNSLPDITSPDLPGCSEVLTGIRQNSTEEGGKDEAQWLRESAWAHAVMFSFSLQMSAWQALMLPPFTCTQIHQQNCMHAHCLLCPQQSGKNHNKNILKTSYLRISRWQESPAFILVGWTTQFPQDWCETVHRRESGQDYSRAAWMTVAKTSGHPAICKATHDHSHCRTTLCFLVIKENTQVKV